MPLRNISHSPSALSANNSARKPFEYESLANARTFGFVSLRSASIASAPSSEVPDMMPIYNWRLFKPAEAGIAQQGQLSALLRRGLRERRDIF